jgi:hypothetical protein
MLTSIDIKGYYIDQIIDREPIQKYLTTFSIKEEDIFFEASAFLFG